MIDEPFGLYRLADAKRDSQNNLQIRKLSFVFKEAKKEVPYTLVSILFLLGWVGLATIPA